MKIDNEHLDLNMTFEHERAFMILLHASTIFKLSLIWWFVIWVIPFHETISSEQYGLSRAISKQYGMDQTIEKFNSANV